MNCPRCDVSLTEAAIKDASLSFDAHSCRKCSGYWIDAEQLATLQADVKRQFVEFRGIPSSEQQMAVINCPACADNVAMNKVANERDKKVTMDVCPNCHNIWLDGGELEAIQQDSLLSLLVDCYRSRHQH